MQPAAQTGKSTLATGKAAVRRLHLLNGNFGSGVGVTTLSLAQLTGPAGHVTGIDLNDDQAEQGRQRPRHRPAA